MTSGIGIAPTTPMVFDFVSPPASIPERYAGSCSQLSKTLRFGDCGFSPDPNANGMFGNSAATLRTASSAANASPMIASGFSLVAMSRNPRSIASAVARLSTCLYSMSPFAAAWFSAAWIAPSHGSSSGVAKTPYTSGLSPPPELAPPADGSSPVVPPQAARKSASTAAVTASRTLRELWRERGLEAIVDLRETKPSWAPRSVTRTE